MDCNATQAAIRAGYSAHTAEVQGSRLLRDARISAAVKSGMEKLSAKVGRTAHDVIEALWKESTREEQGATHSARVAALGLLAKHFGLLLDRTEITGNFTPIINLTIARDSTDGASAG